MQTKITAMSKSNCFFEKLKLQRCKQGKMVNTYGEHCKLKKKKEKRKME